MVSLSNVTLRLIGFLKNKLPLHKKGTLSHYQLQNELIQKILNINETAILQKLQHYIEAQGHIYTLNEFEEKFIKASQQMFDKEGGKSNDAVFKDIEAWLEQ